MGWPMYCLFLEPQHPPHPWGGVLAWPNLQPGEAHLLGQPGAHSYGLPQARAVCGQAPVPLLLPSRDSTHAHGVPTQAWWQAWVYLWWQEPLQLLVPPVCQLLPMCEMPRVAWPINSFMTWDWMLLGRLLFLMGVMQKNLKFGYQYHRLHGPCCVVLPMFHAHPVATAPANHHGPWGFAKWLGTGTTPSQLPWTTWWSRSSASALQRLSMASSGPTTFASLRPRRPMMRRMMQRWLQAQTEHIMESQSGGLKMGGWMLILSAVSSMLLASALLINCIPCLG